MGLGRPSLNKNFSLNTSYQKRFNASYVQFKIEFFVFMHDIEQSASIFSKYCSFKVMKPNNLSDKIKY